MGGKTGIEWCPIRAMNGALFVPDDILTAPLRWRKPRRAWVSGSLGDLFHEGVPDEWIDRVFAVMALAPQHTFQVLTKRSARMRAYANDVGVAYRIAQAIADMETVVGTNVVWPLPNVWCGVSCEDQRRADERVRDLLATPAAVRFVSAEPLLGPIDFHEYLLGFPAGHPASCGCGHGHGFTRCPNYGRVSQRCHRCSCTEFKKSAGADGLHQIIVGGESGPNARPMHPHWARDIRDQCAAAGVAFYFKQHGAWEPVDLDAGGCRDWMIIDWHGLTDIPDGRAPDDKAGEVAMQLVGKARAGRLLDGVEHNGMPHDGRP